MLVSVTLECAGNNDPAGYKFVIAVKFSDASLILLHAPRAAPVWYVQRAQHFTYYSRIQFSHVGVQAVVVPAECVRDRGPGVS